MSKAPRLTIAVEILTLARMWILTETIEPRVAEERLVQFMAEITRQKQRQILLDHAFVNVFWALLAGVAVVLYSRLGESHFSTTPVLTIAVSLALLLAGIVARWQRPDALQLAVVADVTLKLKQRLSTAWEFMRTEPGSEVTNRLVLQAVKQRLPLHTEPVFPVRITTWGKLIPIALALLVLANAIDLGRINEQHVIESDNAVVEEGKRLRDFAEQLGELAERESYSRSVVVAERVRRLGVQMESGSLSRREALSRLRQLGAQVNEEREGALYDGAGLPLDASQLQGAALTHDLETLGVRTMLQNLLDGRLVPGDARALSSRAETLAQLGIDAAMLQQALENFDAGDEQDLLQILKELTAIDAALHDAESLSETQGALQRARENLGDPTADADRTSSRTTGGHGPHGDGEPGAFRAEGMRGVDDTSGLGPGSGFGPERSDRSGESQQNSPADRSDIVLRPKSQLGVGDVFSAEARVLPRAKRSSMDTVELDIRFAAQMESVLSREDYPLHHKEFIRRYFLGLSLGEAAATATLKREQQ